MFASTNNLKKHSLHFPHIISLNVNHCIRYSLTRRTSQIILSPLRARRSIPNGIICCGDNLEFYARSLVILRYVTFSYIHFFPFFVSLVVSVLFASTTFLALVLFSFSINGHTSTGMTIRWSVQKHFWKARVWVAFVWCDVKLSV